MITTTLDDLSPAIARQLAAGGDEFRPSFLNWAVDEIHGLQARITSDTDREERFPDPEPDRHDRGDRPRVRPMAVGARHPVEPA